MCPFLANMATAFSSIVSERALPGRMVVACRSCHSFLEVDEGVGQLAPLPSHIPDELGGDIGAEITDAEGVRSTQRPRRQHRRRGVTALGLESRRNALWQS